MKAEISYNIKRAMSFKIHVQNSKNNQFNKTESEVMNIS